MKKMILVLAGAIIAGGAIFAIQSYASSQDTPLNESEINKLKSTYPKNNNRLTAEMWDSMLDLLARINNNIPDTSIWWVKQQEWQGKKYLQEVFLTWFSAGSSPKLLLKAEPSNNRVPTREGEFLWENGFPEDKPNKLSRIALDVDWRIRSRDPLFPSDVVTKRYLEWWLRQGISKSLHTMNDIARAGDNSAGHHWNKGKLTDRDPVIWYFGKWGFGRNEKELKDFQGKWYTFCALWGVRYNEVSSDNDSCSCNVYKDHQRGWILSAGAHRGGTCEIICTANCF